MAEKPIPQMEPWFGDEEADAVNVYMRSGGWLTEFKITQQFEEMIAAFTGARHCVVTNNGTISLTLAALACGLKAGDEVIVPNYTQIASPNSMAMFGAVPVFCDVEPETLCLDIEKVKALVGPKTKAVMLVAANGRYPKSGIAAFEKLAKDRGLVLIEDSAQALGCYFPDGRHMGTAGLVGSFSFSVPKIITTGQGGCVITNDDQVAKRLRKIKDFGRSGGGNDIHDTIGWNFKFTDMQAAVGVEQMKKLAWRLARKKDIYRRYRAGLAGNTHVRFFDQDVDHCPPWFIDTMVDDREGLAAHLKEAGIGTRVMYPPIHKQKAYDLPQSYPVTEKVGVEGLWLPSASQLEDVQIDRICSTINWYYSRNVVAR